MGVELRNLDGGLPAYPLKPNSEYHSDYSGRQNVGDKLHVQEGKNPDRRLRPPRRYSVVKEVGSLKQPGCWLRSSHHFKSA